MPVIISKLLSKLNINHSIGFSSIVLITIFINRWIKSKKYKNTRTLINIGLSDNKIKPNDTKRAGINKQFLKSLLHFIKILVPRAFTHETWLVALIAISIVGRTMCDVWVVNFTTKIESLIITRQKTAFYSDLRKFIIAAPSIALINNLLRFGIERLKLQFRSKLSSYFYKKYMRNYTFYQLANFDNRIKNVDQLLTDDIEKFCNSLVDLYSNISKPILDILIYVYKLCSALGIKGPGYLLFYLFFSGVLLTKFRKPLTKMTIMEQQFEGEFRFINSRLIANSEEIAFYQGNKKEKDTITIIYEKLKDHLENLIEFRFFMGIIDNVLAKYLATTVGFFSISRIFFATGKSNLSDMSQSEQMHYYYSTGRMMVNMAQAVGRVVLSGRQLASLAGFTVRIQQLDDLLNEINSKTSNKNVVLDVKHNKESEKYKQTINVVYENNLIKFEDVPIITPNGDVLIEKLNFEVKSGCNVLICGPNGCGKSSLFRIFSGLWPQYGGKITKPINFKLFYIPQHVFENNNVFWNLYTQVPDTCVKNVQNQKPYMTIGNLRDQIIYPDSLDLMKMKATEDHQLYAIMKKVQLEYIITRERGWDSLRDWSEVLSGGEKQRVAMARLFYHKPQFAILDECTSAVSVDVEGTLYSYCREIGITLFTVSHRKSLWKHHEYYLYMDGKGNYDFQPISEESEIFGS